MSALFVVGMIVFFLTVEWVRGWVAGSKAPAAVPAPFWSRPELLVEPAGAFFSKGHTWVRIRDDGRLGVGIDAFARGALGKPAVWDLPAPGTKVKKGDALIMAVDGDKRATFKSPVSGTVVSRSLDASLSGSEDWLIKIEPARLGTDLKPLAVAEEVRSWIGHEVSRFREFLAGGREVAHATAADGGVPVDGALAQLDNAAWRQFEDEFLAVER